MRLLHIDASPRDARSHSRRLTLEFVSAWQHERPNDPVEHLDLGRTPPPHVDESWIAAAFATPSNRTEAMSAALGVSDALIAQLVNADVIIVGIPMYNFSVPSGFKAYIDQIVRVGVTFAFEPEDDDRPYKPLVHGKRMLVIVATGDSGYETGGRHQALNHLDPYLLTVFGFLGITDITFVHAGNDEFGGERLVTSLAGARSRIESFRRDALAAVFSPSLSA